MPLQKGIDFCIVVTAYISFNEIKCPCLEEIITHTHSSRCNKHHHVLYCHVNTNNHYSHSVPTTHSLLHITHPHRLTQTPFNSSQRGTLVLHFIQSSVRFESQLREVHCREKWARWVRGALKTSWHGWVCVVFISKEKVACAAPVSLCEAMTSCLLCGAWKDTFKDLNSNCTPS